jgi:quinol-cytochrome oxidoreductase complex cytochrome b subunit
VNGSVEARSARTAQGLRANSLAALVILLIEYGLGIWVNLYGQLPASGNGASLPAGFGRAVADGPIGLSVHAVLGVALIFSAVSAVVRSFRVRRPVLTGAAIVGLVAVVVAALSGARFVGHGTNATSMSMAMAAGIAIGAYAFMLFLSAGPGQKARDG